MSSGDVRVYMKQSCRMPRIATALALVGALSFAGSRSEAISLNLVSGPPDFFASPVTNVTYNSANGHFLATGYASDYQGGSVTLVDVGAYTLEAWFTSAGVLTNGTLTIGGDVGSGQETLLAGTLNTGPNGTAFGSTNIISGSATNSIFEFLFSVSGGNSSVVSDFGGLAAANRGVILSVYYDGPPDTPFGGTWASSFRSHNPDSVADNFVQVPEPSSFFLVLVAGGLCAILRVRHKRI